MNEKIPGKLNKESAKPLDGREVLIEMNEADEKAKNKKLTENAEQLREEKRQLMKEGKTNKL